MVVAVVLLQSFSPRRRTFPSGLQRGLARRRSFRRAFRVRGSHLGKIRGSDSGREGGRTDERSVGLAERTFATPRSLHHRQHPPRDACGVGVGVGVWAGAGIWRR